MLNFLGWWNLPILAADPPIGSAVRLRESTPSPNRVPGRRTNCRLAHRICQLPQNWPTLLSLALFLPARDVNTLIETNGIF
jgi:hypothetical protein